MFCWPRCGKFVGDRPAPRARARSPGHDTGESCFPVLTVSRVGRRFPGGIEALRDASLRLSEADFVVLLGPSGCGKSTLLRLIAGLDQPDDGALVWAGGRPAPGDIGYVFQDATLLPWATAEENVFLPLRLRGVSRAAAMPAVQAVLHRVG